MAFTISAHAKINWALNITGLRADGYHLLDMLMQTIDLRDELSFAPGEGLRLTVNGAPQPADSEDLVLRAARALNAHCNADHGADIRLVKRIPARAGLGGGSADCAAALVALNRLWALNLTDEALAAIGLTLGADVPFCLAGGLARVSGIGENIEPQPDAPELPLVLVRVGDGLSTGAVFRLWDRGGFPEIALDTGALVKAVARRDLAAVDRLCGNALTAPALALMPEIGAAIQRLRDAGAGAAFMTGSGSTAVGAFEDPAAAARAAERIPNAVLTRTLASAGW